MSVYTLTVFDKNGEKLFDGNFEAESEVDAKIKGGTLLKEKGYEENTHRCVSSAGKLILFHR